MKNFEEESLIEDAKSLSVLYVEANKELRRDLSNLLNKYFKKVVSTPYADNAIKLFGSDFFDLVITDINLPDIEATDICSKIKHIAPRKPILLVSKSDDLEKLIDLVNIGICGYIKIPFDKNNVINILSKTVNEIMDLKMMYNYQDNLENNQHTTKKPIKIENIEQPTKASDLLLTKRHIKISASEFLDRYPITLSSSLNGILDINEDLDMHLLTFMNNPTKDNINLLSDEFEKFSSILEHIEEFNDMAFVTNKLSITFRSLEPNKDYKQYSDTFLALSSSLNKWFEDIFINQSADDIHFLDQSMLADALTLEDLFRNNEYDYSDSIEFF